MARQEMDGCVRHNLDLTPFPLNGSLNLALALQDVDIGIHIEWTFSQPVGIIPGQVQLCSHVVVVLFYAGSLKPVSPNVPLSVPHPDNSMVATIRNLNTERFTA